MAATEITMASINRTGAADPANVTVDVANGNTMSNNNGAMWVEVQNPGGVAKTITAVQPNTQDGVASPGLVRSIPAGATRRLGPFPVSIYSRTVVFAHEAGSTNKILGWQVGS